MDAVQTAQYARALYGAHGNKAEAEAAQKARDCDLANKPNEAEQWQAVRRAIRELRGPNQG